MSNSNGDWVDRDAPFAPFASSSAVTLLICASTIEKLTWGQRQDCLVQAAKALAKGQGSATELLEATQRAIPQGT